MKSSAGEPCYYVADDDTDDDDDDYWGLGSTVLPHTIITVGVDDGGGL